MKEIDLRLNWLYPNQIVSAATMSRCVHEGDKSRRGLLGWPMQARWPRAGEVLRVCFFNPAFEKNYSSIIDTFSMRTT